MCQVVILRQTDRHLGGRSEWQEQQGSQHPWSIYCDQAWLGPYSPTSFISLVSLWPWTLAVLCSSSQEAPEARREKVPCVRSQTNVSAGYKLWLGFPAPTYSMPLNKWHKLSNPCLRFLNDGAKTHSFTLYPTAMVSITDRPINGGRN